LFIDILCSVTLGAVSYLTNWDWSKSRLWVGSSHYQITGCSALAGGMHSTKYPSGLSRHAH